MTGIAAYAISKPAGNCATKAAGRFFSSLFCVYQSRSESAETNRDKHTCRIVLAIVMPHVWKKARANENKASAEAARLFGSGDSVGKMGAANCDAQKLRNFKY